jgi:hypothetical protein
VASDALDVASGARDVAEIDAVGEVVVVPQAASDAARLSVSARARRTKGPPSA